ncbi:LAME_0H21022g1_1 [Lachancea meyersii CBS 8951]|uniref:LAME_0H21022g1_1 n=1 Tax=Lachancea meyersii CBS 8951 TaxID=1266667 RepID=A0A1G4KK01_9SACH|nr:LAME_0H21022g1_1 [Lachancea meyersii CBS 8951]
MFWDLFISLKPSYTYFQTRISVAQSFEGCSSGSSHQHQLNHSHHGVNKKSQPFNDIPSPLRQQTLTVTFVHPHTVTARHHTSQHTTISQQSHFYLPTTFSPQRSPHNVLPHTAPSPASPGLISASPAPFSHNCDSFPRHHLYCHPIAGTGDDVT